MTQAGKEYLADVVLRHDMSNSLCRTGKDVPQAQLLVPSSEVYLCAEAALAHHIKPIRHILQIASDLIVQSKERGPIPLLCKAERVEWDGNVAL